VTMTDCTLDASTMSRLPDSETQAVLMTAYDLTRGSPHAAMTARQRAGTLVVKWATGVWRVCACCRVLHLLSPGQAAIDASELASNPSARAVGRSSARTAS
jgi:hypothetical protein